MVPSKSLELVEVLIAMITDVSERLPGVLTPRSVRLTAAKLRARTNQEGLSFLTKTLPSLGKNLDKALLEEHWTNSPALRLTTMKGTQLPKLFGELFSLIFSKEGDLLPTADVQVVGILRDLTFVFYKYELPYAEKDEQKVISSFLQTERDLVASDALIKRDAAALATSNEIYCRYFPENREHRAVDIIREARRAISIALALFDPCEIIPRHGPGAVSTREQLWDKYTGWYTNEHLDHYFPADAYFYASPGHVSEALAVRGLQSGIPIPMRNPPARVCLVPKDSRGPRLISCEPLSNQWIQQGIMRSLVRHVESTAITRDAVHFTDQKPNQIGALLGSSNGKYATLDLKEASDRVSLELFRLLFPSRIIPYLEACRSSATELPNGDVIPLRKFAPMGSSLCFPVLALTIWSLLYAASPDEDTRQRILVYGDDVIVPTAYAANAICVLESFGLMVNRSKSCLIGKFRESCGVDAFKGISVTPTRIRTRWSSSRSAHVYASWIEYENALSRKHYHNAASYIAACIRNIYGRVPDISVPIEGVPRLRTVSDTQTFEKRWNKDLQVMEYLVPRIKSVRLTHRLPGYLNLLRYFSEKGPHVQEVPANWGDIADIVYPQPPLSVSTYTRQDSVKLSWSWR